MEIISRSEAKANGDKTYYTGGRCPNGHLSPRYVSTMACLQCKKEYNEKSRITGIYQILNKSNGKSYIGSSLDIKSRWREHVSSMTNGNSGCVKLQRAWDKYGEEVFEFNIIEIVPANKIELYKREQYYIDKFDSVNNGYNICPIAGTCAGVKRTRETIERIKKAVEGKQAGELNSFYGKHHSEETRKLLSEINTGKTHSEETKAKISAISLGQRHTEETKEHLREVNSGEGNPMYGRRGEDSPFYGVPRSEETKAKLREANLGENSPWWGKTHSEETKAKMSAAAKKRWADKKALKTAS